MNDADRQARADERRSFVSLQPDMQGGSPCVNGTRLTVSALTSFVASGHSIETIQTAYPGTTLRDVQVACWYAAENQRKYRAWKPWAKNFHWHNNSAGLPEAIK